MSNEIVTQQLESENSDEETANVSESSEEVKFDYRKAREERIIRNTERRILKDLGEHSFEEIKEKLDLIDIVFEVIDARIPYSSKNKDINSMVSGKPRVLIMTKIDLCDIDKTNKWINAYCYNPQYQMKWYMVILQKSVDNTFQEL